MKMSRTEWSLVALLIASIFINYIDRGNLSIAAPLIEKELALSPVQIGSLLSSFFWTYALLQLFGVAGWFGGELVFVHNMGVTPPKGTRAKASTSHRRIA